MATVNREENPSISEQTNKSTSFKGFIFIFLPLLLSYSILILFFIQFRKTAHFDVEMHSKDLTQFEMQRTITLLNERFNIYRFHSMDFIKTIEKNYSNKFSTTFAANQIFGHRDDIAMVSVAEPSAMGATDYKLKQIYIRSNGFIPDGIPIEEPLKQLVVESQKNSIDSEFDLVRISPEKIKTSDQKPAWNADSNWILLSFLVKTQGAMNRIYSIAVRSSQLFSFCRSLGLSYGNQKVLSYIFDSQAIVVCHPDARSEGISILNDESYKVAVSIPPITDPKAIPTIRYKNNIRKDAIASMKRVSGSVMTIITETELEKPWDDFEFDPKVYVALGVPLLIGLVCFIFMQKQMKNLAPEYRNIVSESEIADRVSSIEDKPILTQKDDSSDLMQTVLQLQSEQAFQVSILNSISNAHSRIEFIDLFLNYLSENCSENKIPIAWFKDFGDRLVGEHAVEPWDLGLIRGIEIDSIQGDGSDELLRNEFIVRIGDSDLRTLNIMESEKRIGILVVGQLQNPKTEKEIVAVDRMPVVKNILEIGLRCFKETA